MTDFININEYAFGNAVAEAIDWTEALAPLTERVAALETAHNIDTLQFDGGADAFHEAVKAAVADQVTDLSLTDHEDVLAAIVRHNYESIFDNYLTESTVKHALGLGHYDQLLDRDEVEDIAREVVQEWDIDEFVTLTAVEDAIEERLGDLSNVSRSNVNEVRLLGMLNVLVKQVGVLSEDLAALRNMCGLEPHDYMTRLADIDTLKSGAFENVRLLTEEEGA